MKKTDVCKNCRYLHQAKELVNHEWNWFDVCCLFTTISNDYDAYAIVVEDKNNERCECFEERNKEKRKSRERKCQKIQLKI